MTNSRKTPDKSSQSDKDANKTSADDNTPHEKPHRESKLFLGAEGTVSGQGRSGGRLARDIGTRDELKRSEERPAGKTRVRKADELDK